MRSLLLVLSQVALLVVTTYHHHQVSAQQAGAVIDCTGAYNKEDCESKNPLCVWARYWKSDGNNGGSSYTECRVQCSGIVGTSDAEASYWCPITHDPVYVAATNSKSSSPQGKCQWDSVAKKCHGACLGITTNSSDCGANPFCMWTGDHQDNLDGSPVYSPGCYQNCSALALMFGGGDGRCSEYHGCTGYLGIKCHRRCSWWQVWGHASIREPCDSEDSKSAGCDYYGEGCRFGCKNAGLGNFGSCLTTVVSSQQCDWDDATEECFNSCTTHDSIDKCQEHAAEHGCEWIANTSSCLQRCENYLTEDHCTSTRLSTKIDFSSLQSWEYCQWNRVTGKCARPCLGYYTEETCTTAAASGLSCFWADQQCNPPCSYWPSAGVGRSNYKICLASRAPGGGMCSYAKNITEENLNTVCFNSCEDRFNSNTSNASIGNLTWREACNSMSDDQCEYDAERDRCASVCGLLTADGPLNCTEQNSKCVEVAYAGNPNYWGTPPTTICAYKCHERTTLQTCAMLGYVPAGPNVNNPNQFGQCVWYEGKCTEPCERYSFNESSSPQDSCNNDPRCLWSSSGAASCKSKCSLYSNFENICTSKSFGCDWNPLESICFEPCTPLGSVGKTACEASGNCVYHYSSSDNEGMCFTQCRFALKHEDCNYNARGDVCHWYDDVPGEAPVCRGKCGTKAADGSPRSKTECLSSPFYTTCTWNEQSGSGGSGGGECAGNCNGLIQYYCDRTQSGYNGQGCLSLDDHSICRAPCGWYSTLLAKNLSGICNDQYQCVWNAGTSTCVNACGYYTTKSNCIKAAPSGTIGDFCGWSIDGSCLAPCSERYGKDDVTGCNNDPICTWSSSSGKCTNTPCPEKWSSSTCAPSYVPSGSHNNCFFNTKTNQCLETCFAAGTDQSRCSSMTGVDGSKCMWWTLASSSFGTTAGHCAPSCGTLYAVTNEACGYSDGNCVVYVNATTSSSNAGNIPCVSSCESYPSLNVDMAACEAAAPLCAWKMDLTTGKDFCATECSAVSGGSAYLPSQYCNAAYTCKYKNSEPENPCQNDGSKFSLFTTVAPPTPVPTLAPTTTTTTAATTTTTTTTPAPTTTLSTAAPPTTTTTPIMTPVPTTPIPSTTVVTPVPTTPPSTTLSPTTTPNPTATTSTTSSAATSTTTTTTAGGGGTSSDPVYAATHDSGSSLVQFIEDLVQALGITSNDVVIVGSSGGSGNGATGGAIIEFKLKGSSSAVEKARSLLLSASKGHFKMNGIPTVEVNGQGGVPYNGGAAGKDSGDDHGNKNYSTAVIIGATIGGVILLIVLGAVVFAVTRPKKKRSAYDDASPQGTTTFAGGDGEQSVGLIQQVDDGPATGSEENQVELN